MFQARIENDIRNKVPVYSIQVVEATTAKHWRQFDVIFKYWPDDCEQVLVQHLKSFSMGHANAEQLKANVMDALSGLYHDKLLQLSSDGPNVMKALQKTAIHDINKDIVDIGTYNIHKTHNASPLLLKHSVPILRFILEGQSNCIGRVSASYSGHSH